MVTDPARADRDGVAPGAVVCGDCKHPSDVHDNDGSCLACILTSGPCKRPPVDTNPCTYCLHARVWHMGGTGYCELCYQGRLGAHAFTDA